MRQESNKGSGQSGFSLLELMAAMAVTLVIMGMAGKLLVEALDIRAREDEKTDAIADVQRTLNMVTREVANSGFALTDNGLVTQDCGGQAIRFRANLNAFDGQPTSADTSDAGEDVKYYLSQVGSDSYLVRYDVNTSKITVLANRIDSFNIHYFDSKVSYTTTGDCDISTTATESTDKSTATYIVFATCVKLAAVGSPGTEGYHPAQNVTVASDVELRNANLLNY